MYFDQTVQLSQDNTCIIFKSKLHSHSEVLFNKNNSYYHDDHRRFDNNGENKAICKFIAGLLDERMAITISGKDGIVGCLVESSDESAYIRTDLRKSFIIKPDRNIDDWSTMVYISDKQDLVIKFTNDHKRMMFVISINAIDTIEACYKFDKHARELVNFKLVRNHEGFEQNAYVADSMFDATATFYTTEVASKFFKLFDYERYSFKKLAVIEPQGKVTCDDFTGIWKGKGELGALTAAFNCDIFQPELKFYRDCDKKDRFADYDEIDLAIRIRHRQVYIQPESCVAAAFSAEQN